MPLGMEVCLRAGHTVLDGDPATSPTKGGTVPEFSAHVCCGQTAVVHLSYCWALVNRGLYLIHKRHKRQLKPTKHKCHNPRSDLLPREQHSSAFPPRTAAAAARGIKRPAADDERTPASAAGGLTTASWIPGSHELDTPRPPPPLRRSWAAVEGGSRCH